ncbi:MAG: dihydrolipoamide acetyltransferase family protein, partial [Chitinophagaceae bacterium]
MAVVDLVMPKLGESIMEATVLKWHKQAGDPVRMDETVLEIATDKVDSEVPSTAAGVIEEILYKVNDVVPIGTVIARIRTTAGAESSAPVISTPPKESFVQPAEEAEVVGTFRTQPAPSKTPSSNGSAGRFYSPLVLNIAASEGVSMSELESIPGTGNEGRVTKKDILHYVGQRKSGKPVRSEQHATEHTEVPVVKQAPPSASSETQLTTYTGGNVEIIEMDRMRKLIADHMVRSKQTSPHVTSFTEADVTNLVMWREKVKKDFEKREGTKITYTPLFIEAIVRCIKKFPLINCSLDGHTIIVKKDINIGMATALPSGNLIVPVIRNADQLNLVGLAKQ